MPFFLCAQADRAWRALIKTGGKRVHLGQKRRFTDAAQMYDTAAYSDAFCKRNSVAMQVMTWMVGLLTSHDGVLPYASPIFQHSYSCAQNFMGTCMFRIRVLKSNPLSLRNLQPRREARLNFPASTPPPPDPEMLAKIQMRGPLTPQVNQPQRLSAVTSCMHAAIWQHAWHCCMQIHAYPWLDVWLPSHDPHAC
eukprot:351583-Chlamydomonas_euryale.AAC.3